MFDIWLMLGFGVVGYVFKKIGIPLAPFTLALVLQSRRGCIPPGDDRRGRRFARVLVERAGGLHHHAGVCPAVLGCSVDCSNAQAGCGDRPTRGARAQRDY
jgi:hypothetical protein